MTTSVLIVERPGQFRDSLVHEVNQRGVETFVRDDAMEALASLDRLAPQIIVVSDDPGPPGALGLCRMLRRKLGDAAVYRIGEPSAADQLDERSLLLPRAVGASALASAILDQTPDAHAVSTHRAWEGSVASLELGPLLLAIETRWLTGRLIITRPGTEREISFVRGMPIHARSSVLAERLGVLAVRRGLLTEAQVEQALELSLLRNMRIGAALLELGALDGTRLLRLLSAQLLEQLSAACNAGASHARFVLDQSVSTRHPILRVSSLTALLHAAAATPSEDVEQVLDELAEQHIAADLPRPVQQWLKALQLPEVERITKPGELPTVGALRAHLRDIALAQQQGEQTLQADALTLALLRTGTFRMGQPPGNQQPQPEVRAGIRSLSPPSIVSAVVRCSHSDFSRWPVSALTRARTPFEQAIDECLHGERPADQARALALHGPEVDADPRFAEVYALTLSTTSGQALATKSDLARPPMLSELRLRCHGLLKRLDKLEAEHSGVRARVHLLQTRAHAEQALATLPPPDMMSLRAPASVFPREPANDVPVQVIEVAPVIEVAASAVTDSLVASRPPALPKSGPPPDPTLLRAIEPLLQRGSWHELQLLLATKTDDPMTLAPVFALLYAIALKEDPAVIADDPRKPHVHAEQVGITVMSKLLRVPQDSAAAVLIAKRVLRSRPQDQTPKPGASFPTLLVSGVMLVGTLVGFLLHSPLLGWFGK